MVRESRKRDLALGLSFLFLAISVASAPHLTLFSGQVIKQFETYSLAESFVRGGGDPFGTMIPCDGGIRWVLEFPLFVAMSSAFVSLFPSWPALFPFVVFSLFLTALYRLRKTLDPEGGVLAWVAVAATPVFLRFSTQFLPDPFALVLLIFGVDAYLNRKWRISFFFFILACAVKPTVLPSILFFRWAFETERGELEIFPKRKWSWMLGEARALAAFAAPFVLWSFFLKINKISSPLHEGGLLNFTSDFGILLDPKFYSKFLVWTVFKGIGPILAGLGIWFFIRRHLLLEKCPDKCSEHHSGLIFRLSAWSLGIFPYWLIVRRLNFIHDYYSLSFFLPLALLGAFSAQRFLPRFRGIVTILLTVSILQGFGLFVQTALRTPHLKVEERPVFCGHEFRADALMMHPSRVK
ncbi:MAG: hypothetical protein H7301_04005 [Cryobacterium sp.]|nr:hypothetical protein [Oligoflexia bacterium]